MSWRKPAAKVLEFVALVSLPRQWVMQTYASLPGIRLAYEISPQHILCVPNQRWEWTKRWRRQAKRPGDKPGLLRAHRLWAALPLGLTTSHLFTSPLIQTPHSNPLTPPLEIKRRLELLLYLRQIVSRYDNPHSLMMSFILSIWKDLEKYLR